MHSGFRPQITHSQLQLAGCRIYTMPRTFSIFSRHTTIILVDSGNLNMIRGDFRHIDHRTTIVRTTIINRDVYNIESRVTEKQMPLTTSLGNDGEDFIES